MSLERKWYRVWETSAEGERAIEIYECPLADAAVHAAAVRLLYWNTTIPCTAVKVEENVPRKNVARLTVEYGGRHHNGLLNQPNKGIVEIRPWPYYSKSFMVKGAPDGGASADYPIGRTYQEEIGGVDTKVRCVLEDEDATKFEGKYALISMKCALAPGHAALSNIVSKIGCINDAELVNFFHAPAKSLLFLPPRLEYVFTHSLFLAEFNFLWCKILWENSTRIRREKLVIGHFVSTWEPEETTPFDVPIYVKNYTAVSFATIHALAEWTAD